MVKFQATGVFYLHCNSNWVQGIILFLFTINSWLHDSVYRYSCTWQFMWSTWKQLPLTTCKSFNVMVTGLKESTCLHASKPNSCWDSLALLVEEMVHTQSHRWVSAQRPESPWLPGDGLYRKKFVNYGD